MTHRDFDRLILFGKMAQFANELEEYLFLAGILAHDSTLDDEIEVLCEIRVAPRFILCFTIRLIMSEGVVKVSGSVGWEYSGENTEFKNLPKVVIDIRQSFALFDGPDQWFEVGRYVPSISLIGGKEQVADFFLKPHLVAFKILGAAAWAAHQLNDDGF